MGYVSYLEDLREAIDAALDERAQYLKTMRAAQAHSVFENEEVDREIGRLETFHQRWNALRTQIGDLADLARQFDLDLAFEYSRLTVQHEELQQTSNVLALRVKELEHVSSENQRLHQNNVELRLRFSALETEIRSERERRRRAEYSLQEFERKLAAEPEGMERMIDAYSKPADVRFHKPGEDNLPGKNRR